MTVFLDTSALVRLYHQEEYINELKAYLNSEPVFQIVLSQIAPIEFASAIRRKERSTQPGNQITRGAADAILQDFFSRHLSKYDLIPFEDRDMQECTNLINQSNNFSGKASGLRALDAIQLNAALKSKEYYDVFISFDNKLLELARLQGLKLKTWNKHGGNE